MLVLEAVCDNVGLGLGALCVNGVLLLKAVCDGVLVLETL